MPRTLVLAFAAAGIACGNIGPLNPEPGGKRPGSRPTSGGAPTNGFDHCPISPAPQLFQKGLCLCEDFELRGRGFAARSPAGLADVGVNGHTQVMGFHHVQGSMAAHAGLGGIGKVETWGDLSTVGSARGLGVLRIGRDLSVGGDIANVGVIEVRGALRLGGDQRAVGYEKIASRRPYVAPSGPPCDCRNTLDVRKKIEDARLINDNAKVGLGTSDVIGHRDLTLKNGRYFFDRVRTLGKSQITIDGIVAVYIDGSLDSIGDEHLRLTPGSTLDLYVSDRIVNIGLSRMGNVKDPSALRMYVAGDGMLELGALRLYGSLYAPTVDLRLVGDSQFDGAVFARSLKGIGNLEWEAATPRAPPRDPCEIN